MAVQLRCLWSLRGSDDKLCGAPAIVVTPGLNQEARIARDDIKEMWPGTFSVMRAGLDQQPTAQEQANLVAFLKASR
jgi:hypothetical protein